MHSKRRLQLLKLIDSIIEGKYHHSDIPLNQLFNNYNNYPRQNYIGPEERSTYNYGYMETDEMTASDPNIF